MLSWFTGCILCSIKNCSKHLVRVFLAESCVCRRKVLEWWRPLLTKSHGGELVMPWWLLLRKNSTCSGQQTFLHQCRNRFLSVISFVKHSVILVLPDVIVVCDRSVPSVARCLKLISVDCDAIHSGCGVASPPVLVFEWLQAYGWTWSG